MFCIFWALEVLCLTVRLSLPDDLRMHSFRLVQSLGQGSGTNAVCEGLLRLAVAVAFLESKPELEPEPEPGGEPSSQLKM